MVLKKIDRSGLGPSGYDTLKLLKALILQAWYSLSDTELEGSLQVRMDFLLFTDLDENVPDSTTICRFRNLLISRGLLEKALKNINRQLEQKNLKVKSTEGAIVDTTIIESAAAPRKTIDTILVDREEEDAVYEASNVQLLADKDARWLKKGRRSYFGYKSFVTVGARQGYIEKIAVTPANVSECRYFEKAVEDVETSRYYADKGYASAENRAILKKKGLKSGIMQAARKNKPQQARLQIQSRAGLRNHKKKIQIHQSLLLWNRESPRTLLKAIAFNLLKAINIA
jgi:IS5 family transposase